MFGLRNPTTATVPKNHTGTDIAAPKGTKIISATEGKVVYKSSKGDFGKHIKIQINDVIILYAHCNKVYVNEGDIIKQGQEIAEVGSTRD
jgi:murein DD-endopeptidase MepM/ murein hydrolase activator NlpD